MKQLTRVDFLWGALGKGLVRVGVGTLASPRLPTLNRLSKRPSRPGRRKRPHPTATPLPPLRGQRA